VAYLVLAPALPANIILARYSDNKLVFSVIMLNIIMLSVISLNVITLSDVVPIASQRKTFLLILCAFNLNISMYLLYEMANIFLLQNFSKTLVIVKNSCMSGIQLIVLWKIIKFSKIFHCRTIPLTSGFHSKWIHQHSIATFLWFFTYLEMFFFGDKPTIYIVCIPWQKIRQSTKSVVGLGDDILRDWSSSILSKSRILTGNLMAGKSGQKNYLSKAPNF
jgi:hypothetical protein